jgi:hypothetical protein
MKIQLISLYFILQSVLSFSQIKTNGSSCENAIPILDSTQTIQLPASNNTTWYKFRSDWPSFSVQLYNKSGNFVIYESSERDFCTNQNNSIVLFALGDHLNDLSNKYAATKALELGGICTCDNCIKDPLTFKNFKIQSGAYYYIQVIGSTQSLTLQFESGKTNKSSQVSTGALVNKKACDIVFMKCYTYGGIPGPDSLLNKPYNSQEWGPLKNGIHIYYVNRNIQDRSFKIRDYAIDENNSKCALDSLVNYTHPDKKIRITGYVTKGEDKLAETNELKASEGLAKIIKNYLVNQKIAEIRIETEGKGSSIQLYENEKSKISFMYELNRNNRVEIKEVK